MFKFELGQLIFYMENNRVHSAPVVARSYVDVIDNRKEGGEIYTRFGTPGILYSTCHGIVSERRAFATKSELLASL